MDSNAQTIEIITVRRVAKMIVEEQFLNAKEIIPAMRRDRGPDVENAPFVYLNIIDVVGEQNLILDLRRLECG